MPIAALDLGGTKLAGAVFDFQGIVRREVVALDGRAGDDVAKLIEQLLSTLGEGTTIDAVGVAVPGIFHDEHGTVWAPNIPGWEDYPLLARLKGHTSARVAIASDRTCYVLGEAWQGNARNVRNAIFLAVGTGIGAGIFVDGHVLRGAHDIAGAIGWLAQDGAYQPGHAACGNFEYHASGPGIARAAGVATAEQAFEAYARGDARAKEAVAKAVGHWGRAVANLVSLFNPEVIVLGGGVFGSAAVLLDDIYAEALKWAQPISIKQMKLVVSALGPDAGLYGAAAIARAS